MTKNIILFFSNKKKKKEAANRLNNRFENLKFKKIDSIDSYEKIIQNNNTGFTLIELLIVIAVLAILASITFLALDPLKRFQDTRNAKRWAEVEAILSAVKLHQLDNDGDFLTAVDNLSADLYYQIGSGSDCGDTCTNPTVILQDNCVDLSGLISSGHLVEIPIDPHDENASAIETRYYMIKTSNGTITVGACSEEQGSADSVPFIQISK